MVLLIHIISQKSVFITIFTTFNAPLCCMAATSKGMYLVQFLGTFTPHGSPSPAYVDLINDYVHVIHTYICGGGVG